jgi:hypothetical protein
MPFILGTNSIKDTGYDVANSLRLDDSSNSHLSKSISGTNTTKLTVSFWTKRTAPAGTGDNYLVFQSENNTSNYLSISFGNPKIDIQIGGTANRRITNAVYRDQSAWSHVVVTFDTTQSSASDRIKLYVNGTQETSFSTSTTGMSEDSNLPAISSTLDYAIGDYPGQSNWGYNGYLAEFCVLYGQALTPTSFGEFDSDSPTIWKPIDVSGLTYSGNSFYLDFKNSAELGTDVSGNSNTFTENNITAVNQSLDTCTNNFATLNPLNQGRDAGTGIFSEGNLEFESTQTGGNYPRGISSIGVNTGKWYMEMKMLNSESVGIGISNGDGYNELFADFTDDKGYSSANGYIYQAGSGSSYGATFTTNDIIGIALDLDNNRLFLSKNGTFQNSGDPTSSTGAISVTNPSATGFYFFTVAEQSSAGTPNVACNFGSSPYAISSGNADGNGYGNFEYAVPSGYYSLNTKNLAEFG